MITTTIYLWSKKFLKKYFYESTKAKLYKVPFPTNLPKQTYV